MNATARSPRHAVLTTQITSLLLAAACSGPSEPDTGPVDFGPGTAQVSPVPMFPQQAEAEITVQGSTFQWTKRELALETRWNSLCPSCTQVPSKGIAPGFHWAANTTGAVFPSSSTRVWMRGGEMTLTIRNGLGFDFGSEGGSVDAHMSYRPEPSVPGPSITLAEAAWTGAEVGLQRDGVLTLHVPVPAADVTKPFRGSVAYGYSWPPSAVEVDMDPAAVLASHLDLVLALDSVETSVFPYFGVEFSVPLPAGASEPRARSRGISATLHLEVENPYSLPLIAYVRVGKYDAPPTTIPPGRQTFALELDRAGMQAALWETVPTLHGMVRWAEAKGEVAVISPDRVITITGRLEVATAPQ